MISQTGTNTIRFSLTLLVLLGLVACSSQSAVKSGSSEPSAVDRTSGGVGDDAARFALRQVGVPYRYGGASPSGFDCSGLVHYSYRLAGKSVPRTTAQLWNATAAVDSHQMRAGDVLFFRIGGKMSHVGLYIGDSRFVHAPSSGKSVSIESLRSDYYREAFIRAGRPR